MFSRKSIGEIGHGIGGRALGRDLKRNMEVKNPALHQRGDFWDSNEALA